MAKDIDTGDVFDFGDIEDMLGGLLGKKGDRGGPKPFVRGFLAERTEKAFRAYLEENPDVKASYEAASSTHMKSTGRSKCMNGLRDALKSIAPDSLMLDMDKFGVEYWKSGRDESANKKGRMMEYLDRKASMVPGISEEEYANVARHVFPTKDDYINHMSQYPSADRLGSALDSVGALGGLLEILGENASSLGAMRTMANIQADAAKWMAKKDADRIYGP